MTHRPHHVQPDRVVNISSPEIMCLSGLFNEISLHLMLFLEVKERKQLAVTSRKFSSIFRSDLQWKLSTAQFKWELEFPRIAQIFSPEEYFRMLYSWNCFTCGQITSSIYPTLCSRLCKTCIPKIDNGWQLEDSFSAESVDWGFSLRHGGKSATEECSLCVQVFPAQMIDSAQNCSSCKSFFSRAKRKIETMAKKTKNLKHKKRATLVLLWLVWEYFFIPFPLRLLTFLTVIYALYRVAGKIIDKLYKSRSLSNVHSRFEHSNVIACICWILWSFKILPCLVETYLVIVS